MISYNKLWKLLIDKKLNKKKLIELSGVSSSSIAKMTKGQNGYCQESCVLSLRH